MKKMIMNRLILIILIVSILCIPLVVVSQEEYNQEDFLIVTFEVMRNSPIHDKQIFYWIFPLKELEVNMNQVYPIFTEQALSFYSCKEILKGFNNGKLDIEEYRNNLVNLFLMVNKYRKKYQKIQVLIYKNIEGDKVKERVDVYITPIRGTFCVCPNEKGIKHGYMPLGNFTPIDDFWMNFNNFEKIKDFTGFNYQEINPL